VKTLVHLKFALGLLVVFMLATILCGCFQATNKFYADSDVITDKRFEGRFEPQLAENDPVARCFAVVKLDGNNHYTVTVDEGKDWIKLEAVLFKAGTNLFVDISQLADNTKHNDVSDQARSFLRMLRHGTAGTKTNVAIRFEFVETGLEGQPARGRSFCQSN